MVKDGEIVYTGTELSPQNGGFRLEKKVGPLTNIFHFFKTFIN